MKNKFEIFISFYVVSPDTAEKQMEKYDNKIFFQNDFKSAHIFDITYI